jgi:splicing factor 3B subunit 5
MGDPFVCPGLSYSPDIEAVLLKHEGTLGPASTKDDWLTAQHRDTIGSIVQHHDELCYHCIPENVHPHRMRRMLLERLVAPLAPAPRKRDRPVESSGLGNAE